MFLLTSKGRTPRNPNWTGIASICTGTVEGRWPSGPRGRFGPTWHGRHAMRWGGPLLPELPFPRTVQWEDAGHRSHNEPVAPWPIATDPEPKDRHRTGQWKRWSGGTYGSERLAECQPSAGRSGLGWWETGCREPRRWWSKVPFTMIWNGRDSAWCESSKTGRCASVVFFSWLFLSRGSFVLRFQSNLLFKNNLQGLIATLTMSVTRISWILNIHHGRWTHHWMGLQK